MVKYEETKKWANEKKWECEECGYTTMWSYDEMVELGSPVCPDCDCDLTPCKKNRIIMYTREQQEIIQNKHKRIKMVAVAGSGKTTTLIANIQTGLSRGELPSKTAAMTFTNKAADQLISKVPGIGLCGTYHSVYYKLLCTYKKYRPYIIPPNIRRTELTDIKNNRVFVSSLPLKEYEKNIRKYYDGEYDITTASARPVRLIFKEYQAYLRESNFIDYDLIEYETLKMFKDESIAQEIRKRYPYLYVDEFQDTNKIESELIRLWNPEKLFVVGDAAQNIYEWRGTTIDNIMGIDVEESYSLSRSFRCPQSVVDIANKVLEQATVKYHDATMTTEKTGHKVRIVTEELAAIPEMVESIIKNELMVYEPDRIAVLCRTNNQAKDIHRECSETIATTVIGGEKPWDSHIGVLINLYLSVCADTSNNTIVGLFMKQSKKWDNAEIKEQKATKRKGRLIEALVDCPIMHRLLPEFNRDSLLSEKVDKLFEIIPLESIYENVGERMYQQKALSICMANINEYEELYSNNPADFLAWITTDESQSLIKDNGTVKIMTIHAAKGLEYPVVIVPYVGMGTFPLNNVSIDEELRVLYVAFTRAKEKLIIVRHPSEYDNSVIDKILDHKE